MGTKGLPAGRGCGQSAKKCLCADEFHGADLQWFMEPAFGGEYYPYLHTGGNSGVRIED